MRTATAMRVTTETASYQDEEYPQDEEYGDSGDEDWTEDRQE